MDKYFVAHNFILLSTLSFSLPKIKIKTLETWLSAIVPWFLVQVEKNCYFQACMTTITTTATTTITTATLLQWSKLILCLMWSNMNNEEVEIGKEITNIHLRSIKSTQIKTFQIKLDQFDTIMSQKGYFRIPNLLIPLLLQS